MTSYKSATTLGPGILSKVRSIAGNTDIPNTVHRALTDNSIDVVESAKLLASFRQNVDRNEVITAIINISQLHPTLCKNLDEEMLHFLIEYYRSIGAGTACDLIKRMCSIIRKEDTPSRNVAYLLNHVLMHINLLDSEKIRTCIMSELPDLIQGLLHKHKGAAYLLGYTYFSLLMATKEYFNKDASDQFINLAEKDLEKDAYFSILSGILNDQTRNIKLPESVDESNDWELNPDGMLSQLILRDAVIKNTLLNFEEALQFAVHTYVRHEKLKDLKKILFYMDSFIHTELDFFWEPLVGKLISCCSSRFLATFPERFLPFIECDEEPKKKRSRRDCSIETNCDDYLDLFSVIPIRNLSAQSSSKVIQFLFLCALSSNGFVSSTAWIKLHNFLVEDKITSTKLDKELLRTFFAQTDFEPPKCLQPYHVVQILVPLLSPKKARNMFLSSLDDICNSNMKNIAASVLLQFVALDLVNPNIEQPIIRALIDEAYKSNDPALSACIYSPLSEWRKDHITPALETKKLNSKRRRKIVDMVYRDIVSSTLDSNLKLNALQFFCQRAANLLADTEHPSLGYVERLLDWNILTNLEPKLRATIMAKAKPDELVRLINELPEEPNILQMQILSDILLPKIEFSDDTLSILENTLISTMNSEATLPLLCSLILALYPRKNSPTNSMPALIMAVAAKEIAAFQKKEITDKDVAYLINFGKLLLILIKNVSQVILHDQCSLYMELLEIFLIQVGKFIKEFPDEERLLFLLDVCDRIVAAIALHDNYFEKTIPGVVASSVLYWEYIPLTYIRLSSIMPPKLSACLATNLQPAEKRSFARLMDFVKKANKKIV